MNTALTKGKHIIQKQVHPTGLHGTHSENQKIVGWVLREQNRKRDK